MSWDAERLARATLTAICEAGDPRLGPLLAEYGAQAAVAALRRAGEESAWGRRARLIDETDLARRAGQAGLRFVVPDDDEWPETLADLANCAQIGGMGGPPIGLWVAGGHGLAEWLARPVAIVGARAATRYGESVTTMLAAELSDPEGFGCTVVSGGAYGIDASAHRGALASGGRTVGVYAGGLDEPYPRGNARLFERLRDHQLVVSEVAPGIRARRASFLARNRLIAAMSDGTVVAEAALRSGARNTASWAAELGRVVMAVPGPVHSAMSTGCHALIRDGQAVLVSSTADVTALLAPVGACPEPPTRGAARGLDELRPDLLAVREAMPGSRAVTAAELSQTVGSPIGPVVAALTELEVLGLVRRDDQGAWRLKRPTQDRLL